MNSGCEHLLPSLAHGCGLHSVRLGGGGESTRNSSVCLQGSEGLSSGARPHLYLQGSLREHPGLTAPPMPPAAAAASGLNFLPSHPGSFANLPFMTS